MSGERIWKKRASAQLCNRAELVSVLERLLEEEYREELPKGTVWRFFASPGQEFFLCKSSGDKYVRLSIKSGQIHQADMNSQKVKPLFGDIFVAARFKNALARQLGLQGYRLAESPGASFTQFEIGAARERIVALVILEDDAFSEEEKEEEKEKNPNKKEKEEEKRENEKNELENVEECAIPRGQPSMETRSGRKLPKILSIDTHP